LLKTGARQDLVVLSLNGRDKGSTTDTQSTEESHLFLGLFLPGIRMTMRIPVIEGQVQIGNQLIDVLKALAFEARVIVMDEPTSSLTDPEVERLLHSTRP
jgi:ABC-type uncharacterized transport system ATPase subunit